jgi:hypothetical protein
LRVGDRRARDERADQQVGGWAGAVTKDGAA